MFQIAINEVLKYAVLSQYVHDDGWDTETVK